MTILAPVGRFLMVFLLLVTATAISAQGLLDGFDRTERKIVQAALALEREYDGLVDGDFGPRSRSALAAYFDRTAGTGPEPERFSTLLRRMAAEWRASQWDTGATPNRAIHFVRPDPLQSPSGLRVEVFAETLAEGRQRHEEIVAGHAGEGDLYTVRRDRLLVTASVAADGSRTYIRSDALEGGFDTLTIIADEANRGRLQLVASSVTQGDPSSLDPFAAPQIAALIGAVSEARAVGLRVAPDLAILVGAGCETLAGGEVLARNTVLGLILARVSPGGNVSLSDGQGIGIGSILDVGDAAAEVVAASSAILSIGPADILAATEARPGEDVLRLDQGEVAPGVGVFDQGQLVGLVLRVVASEAGALAVTASLPTLLELLPEGVDLPAAQPGESGVVSACFGP